MSSSFLPGTQWIALRGLGAECRHGAGKGAGAGHGESTRKPLAGDLRAGLATRVTTTHPDPTRPLSSSFP